MVNLLLSTKGIEIDAKDSLGNTALHLAAKEDSPNIVTTLIKSGAKVNEENKKGETALDLVPRRDGRENSRVYRAIKSAMDFVKSCLVNATDTSLVPMQTPYVANSNKGRAH